MALMGNPCPLPVALSVAGSDSGAGAGVQADLLTFAACGVYGTTALASLTAQNPDGVCAVEAVPAPFVTQQMEQVAAFYPLKAAKTGMLGNAAVVEAVAAFFAAHREIPLVVDPVMVSSSGAALLEAEGVTAYRECLLPLACLMTPNLDEAEVLGNMRARSPQAMKELARALAVHYETNVLLKGGHLEGDTVVDVLCLKEGEVQTFEAKRIENVDTHGSGCTLSAAIAAYLAKGASLIEAVERGRAYLRRALESPLWLGCRRFINHFPPAQ